MSFQVNRLTKLVGLQFITSAPRPRTKFVYNSSTGGFLAPITIFAVLDVSLVS